MNNPQVTIVVVPRERYQFAHESLESLYENTAFAFNLVYVDNNSPTQLQKYLSVQSESKGFKLARSNRYLSPNQVRNVGLSFVETKYVVFVDNDVIFAPNWLTALVDCAEATDATIVGSLVCQYQPFHEIVHCAGGEYLSAKEYAEFAAGKPCPSDRCLDDGANAPASLQDFEPIGSVSLAPDGERGLRPSVPKELCPDRGCGSHRSEWLLEEKTPYQNQRVNAVRDRLKRKTTGFVEFHSMLVRTKIFQQIGMLDEKFCCTKEYLDFCMSVTRAGGTIYVEPDSVVTFRTHPPAPTMNWSDLPYFMLRWSDAWELSNLRHFQQKWNLKENKYFQRRYKKLGKRRREALIDPLMEKAAFLGEVNQKWLKKRLIKLEKKLNCYLSDRYSNSQQEKAISIDRVWTDKQLINH